MYAVMEEIKKVRKRNHRDYEAIAKLTGKTITEIEADTTAPDAPDDVLFRIIECPNENIQEARR